MKKNLFLYAIFMVFAALFGCTNRNQINWLEPLSSSGENNNGILISEDSIHTIKKKETEVPYVIKIPQKKTKACLDTIFNAYDFIPLEITDKCVIGNITKIIKCKNCFCILDRENKNVFIFEMDGRFRCRLGDKGHGPKEHVDAWNIAYDEKKETITLLDLSGRKLQFFNLNGKCIKELSLYLLFTDFEHIGENIILHTEKSYNKVSDIIDLYQIVTVDSLLVPFARGCKTSEKLRQNFSYASTFKKNNDKVLYADVLSDTIWEGKEKCMTPFIAMDIEGNKKLTETEKLNMTDYSFRERRSRETCVFRWFVTPQFISMAYSQEGTPVQGLIYSRNTGKCKIYGFNESPKRLGDYLAKSTIDGVLSDNTFLKVIQPVDILHAISHKGVKESLTEKELDMVNKLSIEDNPILMLVHPVDF